MCLGDARGLLASARVEVFRVREPADPHAGPAESPCDSCLALLVDFGVLPGTARDQPAPRSPDGAPDPAPARFPPQVDTDLAASPHLSSTRRGPGQQVWISPFDLRARPVAHSADSLADFGAVIGARLLPIGTEEPHSILAVDERGRVFALDQAGEWFLGADLDAALATLLSGRAPARVRDDGSW
jgi:hypothetical protein